MEASHFRNFSSREFASRIENSLSILQNEKFFCDVTITCEGRQIDAHKVVLAQGSRVFNNILKLNPQSHPLIFLSDVKFSHLLNILDFLYQGEVSIDKRELDNFLAVARDLEVNDLTEETFNNSKESSGNKSKKQRLDSSPKKEFNIDYKIKNDNLDDSRTVINDLKIDELEDFEQSADEDFDNLKNSSPKQNLNVEYKIKIAVAHDFEANGFIEEALKDSKEYIDDKSKKQRLGSSPKQQFNLDYKIKIDYNLDDSRTVVNDLKIDALEDFEKFADEDFDTVNDESEGITIKRNVKDSNPKQEVNDLDEEALKNSKVCIEDKNKKQRLGSSPKQQFNLDYKIKTDNKLDEFHVANDLKIGELKDFEQFGDEDFVNDESEGLHIKKNLMDSSPKEKENENSGENEKFISMQGHSKGQSNSRVQRLLIRDISKMSENEKEDKSISFENIVSKSLFECTHCNKTCSSKDKLRTHVLSVHKGKRYPCSHCDYVATENNTLKRHVLSIHEGKRYPCSHCDHKATSKGNLKRHVLSIHERMQYPCSQCDYKANTKGLLKQHILTIHLNVYPFKCEHCNKTFSRKDILKAHVLAVHEGKRYSCSHCDHKATNKDNLKIHVLSIHERMQYPCSQCDYKANTKRLLKQHILSIHEKIRYPCSYCEYQATAKYTLKRHVLSVHEGKRYP